MRGIYKIANMIDDKTYIGESLNIRKRWNEHIQDLKNNNHHNYKLQDDWNKYDEKIFKFEILAVLDENIDTFIDKYILLLYEQKYIIKYNSINKGYNIELTLDEIIHNNKNIYGNEIDKILLSKYYNQIEDNIIKENGGIIYIDLFEMKDLLKMINLNNENELKGILYNNNFIVSNSTNKSFILNENIFNKSDIICNEKFSKIKFNEKVYFQLINYLNETLELGDINFEIDKNKNIIEINEIEIIDETKLYNSITIKDFLESYNLKVKYNNVFKILRDKGILQYVNYKGKKNNYPTEKYKEYFLIKEYESKNNEVFLKLYIKENKKHLLYNILLDNNIISY